MKCHKMYLQNTERKCNNMAAGINKENKAIKASHKKNKGHHKIWVYLGTAYIL